MNPIIILTVIGALVVAFWTVNEVYKFRTRLDDGKSVLYCIANIGR